MIKGKKVDFQRKLKKKEKKGKTSPLAPRPSELRDGIVYILIDKMSLIARSLTMRLSITLCSTHLYY